MPRDTTSELTQGIFSFLQFDHDPNLKGIQDGSDEYIPLHRLVTAIHDIGDEQISLILPFATKLAIGRILETQEDQQKKFEQALDGHLPELRIERKDINTALSVVTTISDPAPIQNATDRLLRAFIQ